MKKSVSSRVFLTVLMVSSTLLVGCSDDAAEQAKNAPLTSVIVSTVENQMINPSRRFVGRVEAVEDAQIQARVSGTLLAMDFEEGQPINEGDLLFEIDPKPYQSEVSKLQAEVNRNNSALTNAKRNFMRGNELIDKGFISAMEMDDLINRRDQAKSSLESSLAALEKAKLDLSYTKIMAPITGLIGRKTASIGDLVGPDSGVLVTIVTVDPIYVTFDITEKLINSNSRRTGTQDIEERPLPIPEIELPNKEIYEHKGRFDFIDNRVDAATGTVKVRAIFQNDNGVLLPGLYVTAIVSRPDSQEAIVIPQSAVSEDQQGHFVMVVNKEGAVENRRVEMGELIDISWVVNKGLVIGEKVIVEGLQKVRTGQQVNAVEQTEKAFDDIQDK